MWDIHCSARFSQITWNHLIEEYLLISSIFFIQNFQFILRKTYVFKEFLLSNNRKKIKQTFSFYKGTLQSNQEQ